MQTISIVLVLLIAVVVSGIVARIFPSIPRPLIQIALGGVIAAFGDWGVTLEPEIFFLLFLPPLLFLDGWRIPVEEMAKDWRVIVRLALGLVLFTVIGIGFFIHWMIPSMPLAVAFALASVISPTDPIAVSSIASRVPIPRRMMHILEGESLLNDASGLVCLRFAIAAALTGAFSIYDASLTFLWLAGGGIAIGVGVTAVIGLAKGRIQRWLGEESASQILISLLIPFAAYLVAEHLHASGILAAVAAGLTMGAIERTGAAMAETRIQRNIVWNTIQATANGVIFVLLGEQLPGILSRAADTVAMTGHHEPWWLAVYVIAINLALAALRFLWVWASVAASIRRHHLEVETPWRLIAATSIAGVRGAVTLAGVLTLPILLNDGTPFPAREVAIFLAMGVILVSLISASVGLPLLLKNLDLGDDDGHFEDEVRARLAAARAGMAAIAAKGDDSPADDSVLSRVVEYYQRRLSVESLDAADAKSRRAADSAETALRLTGVKAERAEIFRLLREQKIGSEVALKLIRELDLMESRLSPA